MKRKILLLAASLVLCAPTTLRAQDEEGSTLDGLIFLLEVVGYGVKFIGNGGNVSFGFVHDGRDMWGRELRMQQRWQLGESRWGLTLGGEVAWGQHVHGSLFFGANFKPIEQLDLELMPLGMTLLKRKPANKLRLYGSLHAVASYDILPSEDFRLGPYVGCAWLPGAGRLFSDVGVRAAVRF